MADYLTPDPRRRIAGGLMAAQYDRATPEEGNVAQRHGLLPLAIYDNGNVPGDWYVHGRAKRVDLDTGNLVWMNRRQA